MFYSLFLWILMVFLDHTLIIKFINNIFLAFFLLSPFSIIIVNITILAHTCSIKLIMSTIPWFFSSSIFMIAIVAHSFSIMSFINMSTFILLFTKVYKFINTFSFLIVLTLFDYRYQLYFIVDWKFRLFMELNFD